MTDSKPTIANAARTLPPFSDDPADRLRHTLAAFESDVTDEDWAIRATSNVIPGHPVTGVTWGDLREILRRLG